jgi:hypothetical protein
MEAVSAAAEVSAVVSADLAEAPSVAEEAVLPGKNTPLNNTNRNDNNIKKLLLSNRKEGAFFCYINNGQRI